MLADTMTTVEVLALRRRNGIILLPAGCVEMHDTHVGLACDSPRRCPAVESMTSLAGTGVTMPYHFVSLYDHVGKLAGLKLADAPRIAELYREEVLKKAGDLPANFLRYQEEMWSRLKEASWDSLETE